MIIAPRLRPVVWLRVWMALFAVMATAAGVSYTPSVFAANSTAPMPVIVNSTAVVAHTGGDRIRIRNGPGTSYAILAYAYEGQTAGVLDGPSNDTGGYRWFKVQAPAGTGWMAAQFLQGTGDPLTGPAVVANTGGDPLRVRTLPNVDGQVLILLDPGTSVTVNSGPVTDDTGIAWYSITARDITGWAMAQYLSQEGSAAAAQVTTSQPSSQPPAAPAAPAAPGAPPAPPAQPASTTPPAQSGGMSRLDQYRLWMEQARAQYPYRESVAKMWSVMLCESGGNPGAVGGGYYRGLFQYAPSTWAGSWNPYRNNSIWDPWSQIFATAKAWSIGMQHAWSCY